MWAGAVGGRRMDRHHPRREAIGQMVETDSYAVYTCSVVFFCFFFRIIFKLFSCIFSLDSISELLHLLHPPPKEAPPRPPPPQTAACKCLDRSSQTERQDVEQLPLTASHLWSGWTPLVLVDGSCCSGPYLVCRRSSTLRPSEVQQAHSSHY